MALVYAGGQDDGEAHDGMGASDLLHNEQWPLIPCHVGE